MKPRLPRPPGSKSEPRHETDTFQNHTVLVGVVGRDIGFESALLDWIRKQAVQLEHVVAGRVREDVGSYLDALETLVRRPG